MLNIQEEIKNHYPLTNKMDCDFNCYCLAKRRYLVFWDAFIEKGSMEQILKELQEKTNNANFKTWKTFIVVGKTTEEFQKAELLYFNNVNMFVVFYLVNDKENKIYMDNSWIFPLGCNYKKYVNRIHEIITNSLRCAGQS